MENVEIIRADIGDFLYIIIFIIVALVGLFEKVAKSKRPPAPVPPPQQYDEFEDVEQDQQAPPQTLEELMRRMMQTAEAPATETPYQEKVTVPDANYKSNYQPIVCDTWGALDKKQFPTEAVSNENETFEVLDFEFDVRQAVIFNEILNKKY